MAIAREETPGFASKSLGNDHLLTFDQLDLSFQGGSQKNQNVGTPCKYLFPEFVSFLGWVNPIWELSNTRGRALYFFKEM